jgi:hypothetical protein
LEGTNGGAHSCLFNVCKSNAYCACSLFGTKLLGADGDGPEGKDVLLRARQGVSLFAVIHLLLKSYVLEEIIGPEGSYMRVLDIDWNRDKK